MKNRQQLIDTLLRTHFYIFLRKVFETLHPGTHYVRSWHLKAISHKLDLVRQGKIRRLIVTMPPRATKSICISIAWPAFLMGHYPSLQTLCVSYSQTLPADFSRQFRQIIQSDWYRRIFPGVDITKATEELIQNSKGGRRFATSVGGPLTGFGGDIIIIDDPLNSADAYSEAARNKVNGWFGSTLVSRLNNPASGAIILVMQRLHEDDLAGHLIDTQPGVWDVLSLPAIAEQDEKIAIGDNEYHFRKNGDLLEPIRLSQQWLDEQRVSMGSSNFFAQYQQSPVPAQGDLLKLDAIKFYKRLPDRVHGRVVQSWDTAMKGNIGADYSVCTTWLELDQKYYLIDVFRERLVFPKLVDSAFAQYHKHRPDWILIEDRASGISLIQQLRAMSGIPIFGIKPERDKEVRFQAATAHFEAGKVFFPEDAPWLAELLKELLGFPGTRYDDQVDSVSQYLGWISERNAGAQFSADFFHGEADPTPGDIASWLVERPIMGAPRF